jgi:chemotaxis protein CheD
VISYSAAGVGGVVTAVAEREARVKVADWAVAREGRIVTIGLGSCVAICLHDAIARIGALAHILLPTPSMSRDVDNQAKFPSTAVPMLVEEMRRLGSRGPIVAKIAGGASMFRALLPAGGINMGERNVGATRDALATAVIRIVGEDTGGDYGRSVYLDVATGIVTVRSLKTGDVVL